MLLVLAGCPAVAPSPNVPVAPPAYPPQIAQLTAARRAEIARELSTPYKVANVNIDAFGDIELHSWDPALVEQRQEHGAFIAGDVARLEKFVSDHAALFHVTGAVHFTANGRDLVLDDKTADGIAHVAITRSWDESSDNHVWALLTASFRHTLAMPDTTQAAEKVRARLVGTEFDRVVHFYAHPCDPVTGHEDECPRSQDERKRITIAREQVIVGSGVLEIVRDRGKPLETHAVVCAAIAAEEQRQDATSNFVGTTVSYMPVDPKLQLPLVVDAITGEDLTAQVHAHGSVGCGPQITGAGYDSGELEG